MGSSAGQQRRVAGGWSSDRSLSGRHCELAASTCCNSTHEYTTTPLLMQSMGPLLDVHTSELYCTGISAGLVAIGSPGKH